MARKILKWQIFSVASKVSAKCCKGRKIRMETKKFDVERVTQKICSKIAKQKILVSRAHISIEGIYLSINSARNPART
jgi:hypothetical protein